VTEYTKEQFEEYRRQQDEKAAKEAEERQEKAERESARRAWIRDGGREADFERQWATLRDEGRRRRVLDADKRAREEMRASGISRI
jgi:hypothetical protein